MEPGTPRSCSCHDEPMYWNRDPRKSAGGFWTCRVTQKERAINRYHSMDGVAYNRRLLQLRRTKALARRRAREER